jgi:septum formation protein
MWQPPKRIILASGSPRRKEILSALGLDFEVQHPTVDEKNLDVNGLSPFQQVCALAEYKGRSIAEQCSPDCLVIAADTLVTIEQHSLGKPSDRDEAFTMLKQLAGKTHSVFSGISIFYQTQQVTEAFETRVRMRARTAEQIHQYIETGEPLDKAGAYAIQGYGSLLVDRIEGCYFNVVGLSPVLLDEMCYRIGVKLVF